MTNIDHIKSVNWSNVRREALEFATSTMRSPGYTDSEIIERATAFAEFLDPAPTDEDGGSGSDTAEGTAADFNREVLDGFDGVLLGETQHADIDIEVTQNFITMRIETPNEDGTSADVTFFGFDSSDIAEFEAAIAEWNQQR